MARVERNFWPPSVTSQFAVCPIPFHFDTYRGCKYACLFCFARDFIRFARRSLAHPQGLVTSEEFGKCLVNFTRGSKNSHRTIAEMCREYNERENARTGIIIK